MSRLLWVGNTVTLCELNEPHRAVDTPQGVTLGLFLKLGLGDAHNNGSLAGPNRQERGRGNTPCNGGKGKVCWKWAVPEEASLSVKIG
jgi:hypothetical protein